MFDWLESFEKLKDLLGDFLSPFDKILVLGCGNANFSEDMYDAGYKKQWNIDISRVVIEQMRQRNRSRKYMLYEVMDCCDLKYPDNFFDIIIDKSTIDAILCGDNAYVNTALMMKESQRVLKEDGGRYVAISYGTPDNRSFHFTRKFLSWKLTTHTLTPDEQTKESEKNEVGNYVYVCEKRPDWREVY